MALPGTTVSSLYVGDLAKDVTETDLYSTFSPFGKLVNVRIPRDAATRASLGYGYVNFEAADAADAAQRSLAYVELKGKPMRVMKAQRDPLLRRSAVGNVCIKELPPTISARAVWSVCSDIAPVLSVKVPTGPDGKTLGFAFVQFESEEAAATAIATLSGETLQGMEGSTKGIVAERYVRKEARGKAAAWTNLLVRNVPRAWGDAELRACFAPHGEITSAAIAKGADGASKGMGFVNFRTQAEAEAAIKALDGAPVGGGAADAPPAAGAPAAGGAAPADGAPAADGAAPAAPAAEAGDAAGAAAAGGEPAPAPAPGAEEGGAAPDAAGASASPRPAAAPAPAPAAAPAPAPVVLSVVRHQKKSDRLREAKAKWLAAKGISLDPSKAANLYVKNLAEGVDDGALRDLFKQFGTITSAKVVKDASSGVSRGFGFVSFAAREDAEAARAELHKRPMPDGRPLYVSWFEAKSAREQHAAAEKARAAAAAAAAAAGRGYGGGGGMMMGGPGGGGMMGPGGGGGGGGMMMGPGGMMMGPGGGYGGGGEFGGGGGAAQHHAAAAAAQQQQQHQQAAAAQQQMMMMGFGSAQQQQAMQAAVYQQYHQLQQQMLAAQQQQQAQQQAQQQQAQAQAAQAAAQQQAHAHAAHAAAHAAAGGGQGGRLGPGGPGQGHGGGHGGPGGPGPGGAGPGGAGGPLGGPGGAPRPAARAGLQPDAGAPRGAPDAGGGAPGAPAAAAGGGGAPAPRAGGPSSLGPAFVEALSRASKDVQRNMLGEQLYPRVVERAGHGPAGKITGMLLELETGELLNMLEDPSALASKVDEAVAVLRNVRAGAAPR